MMIFEQKKSQHVAANGLKSWNPCGFMAGLASEASEQLTNNLEAIGSSLSILERWILVESGPSKNAGGM